MSGYAGEMVRSAKTGKCRAEFTECETDEVVYRGPWRKRRSAAWQAALAQMNALLAVIYAWRLEPEPAPAGKGD